MCETAKFDIQKVVDENMHIGEILVKIVENKYDFRSDDSRKFWTRSLCECATELEDVRGLYAVVTEPELLPAHTAVRKAFTCLSPFESGMSFLNFSIYSLNSLIPFLSVFPAYFEAFVI